MSRFIRAIAKRPDSGWYVTSVSNSLESLQRCVGGYIEVVGVSRGAAIVCNEEGLLQGLPYNCTVQGISYVGDILVLGVDGEGFTDCPLGLKEWRMIAGAESRIVLNIK